ncbi:uncharacterized protein IUM83_02131 [Phytophthora cinnamomi]|uniref:uncharacterized protein n=1 Tax=Phytophthora cinnamomi TaxID=4785 RepID=UPI00355A0399|nr:hypothetical protein IUM83_02131 [Phytophthora cinnamomi]
MQVSSGHSRLELQNLSSPMAASDTEQEEDQVLEAYAAEHDEGQVVQESAASPASSCQREAARRVEDLSLDLRHFAVEKLQLALEKIN